MVSDWSIVTVDEIKSPKAHAIAMGPFGSDIKSDNFVPTGVPVIRGVNLGTERFNDDNFVFLTDQKAEELHSANAYPEDIIFTHRGTLGQVGIIPHNALYHRYVVSQSQMKLSCDTKKVDPLFIFYYFRSHSGQHALLANTSTTGVPAIARPLTSLKSIPLPLPPISEQHVIALTLSTLDDKIELNRHTNKTLESMASAIFKSWFIDFDPMRVKMEGNQPFGLDADTAALFPDTFEDSQLGRIPKGWKVKSLSDCVTYLSRGIAPRYLQSSPIRVLNQRAIRWWHIDEQALKFHDPNKSVRNEAYIRKGDVVINSTGDITIGRAYWFYHEVANLFADSHVSIIRTVPDILLPEIVVFQIETQTYQDIIYSHVTGSTGQLELNRSNLAQLPFLCPPIELQRKFSAIIEPLFNLVWNNKEQSRTLTSIRDALLPKLLSGEIRVKDAEKYAEAHL